MTTIRTRSASVFLDTTSVTTVQRDVALVIQHIAIDAAAREEEVLWVTLDLLIQAEKTSERTLTGPAVDTTYHTVYASASTATVTPAPRPAFRPLMPYDD